ncbi:interferon-induced very large GTPase 1 [Aulostomus maculatus]
MSGKLSKRLSSKKKRPVKDNVQTEILLKLGLKDFLTTPLDPVSILDISTWSLENLSPLEPKDLPKSFLQRLWLLSPDARSPCCKCPSVNLDSDNKSHEEMTNGYGEDTHCAVNPLDLVAAVFMSASTFLQQEIAVRMVQCQFAVPLVLPHTDPEKLSSFLLWPFRAAVSQWRYSFLGKTKKVQEGDLASTSMPMFSFVKLGSCSVSKSKVLNNIINEVGTGSETFLHREMDGGQLPRRLSNGLVEVGWYIPSGDLDRDIFPVPVTIANLRGEASMHEKSLSLLCHASSAVIVFCGNLREKEKQLLAYCKGIASKLIVIDLEKTEVNENRVVGFVGQSLKEEMCLPEGSLLSGGALNEEDLANTLCNALKDLFLDRLECVTLEAAAKFAATLGLHVDEGVVSKKAMATADEVLKGLDQGSAIFMQTQLPLQGALWSNLAEIEKQESKESKDGKEHNPQLQKEKKDILVELSSYKMTPAMKRFTDALFTTDMVERMYFLSWMKIKLRILQIAKQNSPQDVLSAHHRDETNGTPSHSEHENGTNDDHEDSDSFCTDSSFEEEEMGEQLKNTDVQVSRQQSVKEEDLDNLQMSTHKNTKQDSQQNEHLESICNKVIEQQLSVMSNGKGEEILEQGEDAICVEEHISSGVVQEQNIRLKPSENESLSFQGNEQDEPELIQDQSSMTMSTNQPLQPDSSTEDRAATFFQPVGLGPFLLGLEHFLREMGLIFELTHVSPGSGSHNVLRLPSIAADLIFYGIPLEIMDGDASNIPIHWLGCVFAEIKRRLPPEQYRTRILTSLGVHHASNAEVLSALFGANFPEGRERSTRGLYMIALNLPMVLREDMACDYLLLIDVEGLCSVPSYNKINAQIHDNEMATVATGLSDVLIQNISSHSGTVFESNLTIIINALLRVKECGNMPICQLLAQDEGIYSMLQATQLSRVSDILQLKTEERGVSDAANHYVKSESIITYIKWPWHNTICSKSLDTQYSKTVLKLKQNLFEALKKCAVKSEMSGLSGFMGRLCAVWNAVKADSFSTSLQNTDIALAFSMVCTELSQWEHSLLEHMERWFIGATKRIHATKAKALIRTDLLSELKDEAGEEVNREVNKHRANAEATLMNNDHLKMHTQTFKPLLLSKLDEIQDRAIEDIKQRLETVNEDHCCSTQLNKFETLLKKEQESKLQELVETSRSTKHLFRDAELEEEFEGVWTHILSEFDFRPSEKDDITTRVTDILRENLISRGLQKHIKKLADIDQNQTTNFQVYDEHFGYRSRLKHMFEDNNRLQRVEAQQLACNIIEEYNQFAADKSSLLADFSDSYITEVLEKVEKALKEKSMEIKTAFEVDLKMYVCNAACRDFQKIHDRYTRDGEVLTAINAIKSTYLEEFIYQFRKRDQCQRLAHTFTSMIVKPTVLEYIYRPIGMQIVEEIQSKAQQYMSPKAFHKSLLEELIKEDRFEGFIEYLRSFDSFRLRKLQETVVAHLSESTSVDKWRQQRLGEIVGKIAAAVSQMAEGTSGVLSDTKPLLERVCLTLEKDGDVNIPWASLNGPLFNITTEWDRFITCLMELLAAMRLDFAQEFCQSMDTNQLLHCLPIHPGDSLCNRLRGCEKQCPVCRAPCEADKKEHEVHRASLHRPQIMVPSSSLSSITSTKSLTHDNLTENMDLGDISLVCKDIHALYPDWSNSPDDPGTQKTSIYWRYVLARFNDKFAQEYEHEPANIPEEWKRITQEEVLDSLKGNVLLTGQY